MGLWSINSVIPKKWHGRYAGYGIRLGNHTFLAHIDSCINVNNAPHNIAFIDPFELNMPEKINVSAGPAHQRPKIWSCALYQHVGKHTDFDLYDFHWNEGKESYIKIYDKWNILKALPPLQNDTTVTKDCYLYAYSANQAPIGEPQEVRTFSKYRAFFNGCRKNNRCSFKLSERPEVGRICPELSDTGAPVVCGGKVSFVVGKQGDLLENCDTEFFALKIAPYYKDIKLAMTRLEYKKQNKEPFEEPSHWDYPISFASLDLKVPSSG